MSSGTSRNGGSHSPGANLTSNDAHEHVIDINQEPVKQDLPKKETRKLSLFSLGILNPLKLSLPFRSSSTSAAKMNRFSSPPLKFRRHISLTRSLSSPLPTSSPWPLSDNQNPPMPFQDLQEAILITNNQKLPDSVRIFSTASDQLQDVVRGLEERVKAALEGWTSTSCREDKLAASTASLEEVVNKVKAAIQNQSNMQKKQQSDGKSLDAELRRIILCKDNYNTNFTYLAAFFLGCVFFAAKLHPMSVAVIVGVLAAGASYVSIAVKNRLDSYHDELKIPVEKRKEITNAISGACTLALEDLHDIEELASTLKSQTESMLEVVDSEDMESDVIVTEMETLKQGFQQLETKVDRCSKNAVSRSQALVDNILNKLD